MGASSLILALSALWTGPSWGQDRSGVEPIVPEDPNAYPRYCSCLNFIALRTADSL